MISVIIPVCNNARTLRRCLNSVVLQDAPSEIIAAVSASEDDSLEICIEYGKTYENVIVFDIRNQEKPGTAAIKHSSGSHVLFVDPTDELNPNALRALYGYLETYDPDMISFAFERMNGRTGRSVSDRFTPGLYRYERKKAEIIPRMIAYIDPEKHEPCTGICASINTKLFKRDALENDQYRYVGFHRSDDGKIVFESIMRDNGSLLIVQDVIFRHYFRGGGDAVVGVPSDITGISKAVGEVVQPQISLAAIIEMISELMPENDERITTSGLTKRIAAVAERFPKETWPEMKRFSMRYKLFFGMLRHGLYRTAAVYFRNQFAQKNQTDS